MATLGNRNERGLPPAGRRDDSGGRMTLDRSNHEEGKRPVPRKSPKPVLKKGGMTTATIEQRKVRSTSVGSRRRHSHNQPIMPGGPPQRRKNETIGHAFDKAKLMPPSFDKKPWASPKRRSLQKVPNGHERGPDARGREGDGGVGRPSINIKDTRSPKQESELRPVHRRKSDTDLRSLLFQPLAIPESAPGEAKKRFPKAKMKTDGVETLFPNLKINVENSNNIPAFPGLAMPSHDEPSKAPDSSTLESVRMLICTVNLGNAPPDYESLNALIPNDGCMEFDMQNDSSRQETMDDVPPPPPPPEQSDVTASLAGVAEKLKISEGESEKKRISVNRASTCSTDCVANGPIATHKPNGITHKTSNQLNADSIALNKKVSEGKSLENLARLSVIAKDGKQSDADSIALNRKASDDATLENLARLSVMTRDGEKSNETESVSERAANDDYEAFLSSQAAHNEASSSGDTDNYESFLAAQSNHSDDFEDDDDYEAFLFFSSAGRGGYEDFLAAKASADDGFQESLQRKEDEDFFAVDGELNGKAKSIETTKEKSFSNSISMQNSFSDLASSSKQFTNTLSDFMQVEEVKVNREESCDKFTLGSWDSPAQPPTALRPPSQLLPQSFEIIVIGMQEATFETDASKDHVCYGSDDESVSSDDEDFDPKAGGEITRDEARPLLEMEEDDEFLSYDSEERSQFSSDSEEDLIAIEETYDEEFSESDDEDDSPTTKKKSKSLKGKVVGATLKAGKATLKAGKKTGKATLKVGKKTGKATLKAGKKAGKATLKVGSATIKAGKAAKTLTTAKDHTHKKTPTPQQTGAPLMDGGMSSLTDTAMLHYMIDEQLPSYKRALSYQLGEMRMMVYYKPLAVDLDVLSVKTHCTGKHGLANKGGIVAEVAVNQSTRLSFLSAHLEAHEGEKKFAKRCSSFRSILHRTTSSVTPFRYDASLSSHFSFVLGDLNFRTTLPGVKSGSPEHVQRCHEMAAREEWRALNKYDELSRALRQKLCLTGFSTPYCDFHPTFKVQRKESYEYNIKRSPSYTDRILYKAGDQLEDHLKMLFYEPVAMYTSSDHKPIRGAFDVSLNETVRVKPAWDRSTLKLHMFVSSIRCVLEPKEYASDEMPKSFVAFVSTPKEAVKVDVSKRGSSWKSFGLGGLKKSKSKGESSKKNAVKLSKVGWPGTTVMPDSFKPRWDDEEVHFEVRTHYDDGVGIDLSGALLYISVFDYKGGGESKLLGSFPLNMARLIAISRESEQQESTELTLDGSTEIPFNPGWSFNAHAGRPSSALKSAGSKTACPTPVRRVSKTLRGTRSPRSQRGKRPGGLTREESLSCLSVQPSKSMRDIIRQASKESSDDGSSTSMGQKLQELKITSLKLDEPLRESGKEIGRISCSIDTWWMDDTLDTLGEDRSQAAHSQVPLL